MIYYLLLLLACFQALFSEEDFVEEPFPLESASSQLATLNGEPSAFIHTCVNVITGSYTDFQTDLALPGIEPLQLERAYSSADSRVKEPWDAWKFNHDIFICQPKAESGHAYGFTTLHDSFGSRMEFDYIEKKTAKKQYERKIACDAVYKGYTNAHIRRSRTGKTHPALRRLIKNRKTRTLLLKEGTGTLRTFAGIDTKHPCVLQSVKRLNGNGLNYHYSKGEKKPLLYSVEAVDKNQKSLGRLFLSYKRGKDWAAMEASIGEQHATYHYERKKYYRRDEIKSERETHDAWLLKKVERSQGSTETFTYDHPPGKRPSRPPRLIRKELPEGRSLEIQYYSLGVNKKGPHEVEVKDWLKRGRVALLEAPIGANGAMLPIYYFLYSIRKVDHPFEQLFDGYTDVYDAQNHQLSAKYIASAIFLKNPFWMEREHFNIK